MLPFADWAACAPVLAHAGRVIVGGCRDAVAARRLGFVPSHSPQAALEMAAGVAGEGGRLGVLLAPPYPPIVVGLKPRSRRTARRLRRGTRGERTRTRSGNQCLAAAKRTPSGC